MNLLWIYLPVIFAFGIVSIYDDIKRRKVSNIITNFFLLSSLILFLINIYEYAITDYIYLSISILLSYFIYHKDVWGAADGKIFIAISMLLISFSGYIMILEFLLNLLLIYALSIIIISIIYTNKKTKLKVLSRIRYGETAFYILVLFTLAVLVFSHISNFNTSNLYLLLLVFILFIFSISLLSKPVKRFFGGFDENSKIVVLFTFSTTLFFFFGFNFIFYFTFLFLIKTFLDFITKLIRQMYKDDKYQSPFTIYLFASAIITMIIDKTIIQVIVIFFS